MYSEGNSTIVAKNNTLHLKAFFFCNARVQSQGYKKLLNRRLLGVFLSCSFSRELREMFMVSFFILHDQPSPPLSNLLGYFLLLFLLRVARVKMCTVGALKSGFSLLDLYFPKQHSPRNFSYSE